MEISEQGLALIRQFEGYSPRPYFCPAGKLTIGYGHVISPDEIFTSEIDVKQAEILLGQDVNIACQAVCSAVTIDLLQNQFDALATFTYNVGIKAFENSTLLRVLNLGDLESAAAEFGRWVYANGQKLQGLVRRRDAEASLFKGE